MNTERWIGFSKAVIFTSILTFGVVPIYAQQSPAGWSDDIRITNTSVPSVYSTIVVDLNENIYLTWAEGPEYGSGWYDDIYYIKLDRDGNIITPNTKLTFSGYQEDTSIAIDVNNNLHIAWHNYYGPATGEKMFHRSIDDLGNISSGTQMTFMSGNTDIPLLAIDSNNDLHLVFQNDKNVGESSRRRDLFYKKYRWDGTNLTELLGPIELTTQDAGLGYVNNLNGMVLDQNDNIHIVWADWRDYASYNLTEIYYMKLNNVGGTLISELRLTPVDGNTSTTPVIAVDPCDNIHIAWIDLKDPNGEVYYTKLDEDGNTLVDDKKITCDSSGSEKVSMATDSSGYSHVIWSDNRDGNWEVYYTELDNVGNQLVYDTRITSSAGDSLLNRKQPSLTIDPQNRIHITWSDKRDGNYEIYYKHGEMYNLKADICRDGIVNFCDFAVLASYWLQDSPLADIAPIGGDDIVDYFDLETMAVEWLLTEVWF